MLGVNFDRDFSFTTHIKEICVKAGKQINVLGRLAHLLNTESRMCIFILAVQTASIEYLSPLSVCLSVCLCVCLSVCLCVSTITQKINGLGS